ncbi:MAG: nucleoside triphosphate pyrophosphohydrolase [Firmicutes bacterium]|nr:nucleoside triphosphate pyrophosphohydrolase [Bacillota bacterium]
MSNPKTISIEPALERLVTIMARLRGNNGCPWDREQTHQSLKPCVIEETYEVVEAIDSGRPDKLCEELGDLLLQIVFHAQLASENGDFGMGDVINGISEKLIRRHPHVFGDTKVTSVSGVIENWDKIKQSEFTAERKSVLDGVPKDLPALMKAEKLQSKAAKVGFDWGNLEGPLKKVKEEFGEFEELLQSEKAPSPDSPEWDRLEDEFGDILFALVNVGRFMKINPELALLRTNRKFVNRFHYIEEEATAAGKELTKMGLEEMDLLWEAAKDRE